MTHPYTPAQLEAFLEPYPLKPLVLGSNASMDHYETTVWERTVEAMIKRRAEATPDLARLVLEKDKEIARLKAALKPFADAGPGHVRSGIWHHHDGHDALILTAEDFTEARQAREGNQ